ncbi:hypothetical protein OY671_008760, partial [Metschnikowia pulcherrima]
CQSTGHGRGGIASDHHPVRSFGVHHPAKPGQQCGGQPVERLVRAHQVQIVIGHDPRDFQHSVQHAPVLRRNAGHHAKARVRAQGVDYGKHLDGFGAGAEYDEDGLGHRHALITQSLNPCYGAVGAATVLRLGLKRAHSGVRAARRKGLPVTAMYPPIAATPQPRAEGSVSAATRVTVVGSGYVGSPSAVASARQFFVTGLDIDRRRIAELSEGHDRTGE